MSNPPDDRIEEELQFGRVAQKAYDTFIKGFIAKKRDTLYDNFLSAGIDQVAELQEVKRIMSVLDTMEDDIMTIINTGKMATKMKEDNEPTGEL